MGEPGGLLDSTRPGCLQHWDGPAFYRWSCKMHFAMSSSHGIPDTCRVTLPRKVDPGRHVSHPFKFPACSRKVFILVFLDTRVLQRPSPRPFIYSDSSTVAFAVQTVHSLVSLAKKASAHRLAGAVKLPWSIDR